jgi:murein DD-endopeptidase MepM/ murein hydrolase activator NlpD
MSTNQIGMETFLASNPFLTSLNATVGEQVVTPDKGGALHYISKGETLGIISKIYNIPESEIRKFNKIGPFHPLKPGRVLFIPKGKPRVFTREFFPRYIARKQFIVPTNGWVASRGFGYHINPFTGKMAFHKGIDMKASAGTPIFAVMDGTVTTAGPAGTYGNLVIIRHNNGMETYYAHCSRIFVRPGEEVKQRKCIATVGDTGWATVPHLHFEIRTNGIPVDPLRYLW